MEIGGRRRPHGFDAWRHGLALTLLLTVVGGAGGRSREDGASAVATATGPRPFRTSADYMAYCQAPWFVGGLPEHVEFEHVLTAAPMCVLASLLLRPGDPRR